MRRSGLGSGESKLETTISYVLIIGVIVSLILEVTGIIFFWRSYGGLSILLEDKTIFIQGSNFFSFMGELFTKGYGMNSAILILTFGTAVLILTPYVRVVASALYFAWKKDIKYFVITIFVLIVLTVSLALH